MIIAVTSHGPDLDSPLDPRFGRATCFVVLDTDTGETTCCDNAQNLAAAQGAGIQAAKTMVGLGAEALLTGHVGPKAFAALRAGAIDIYTGAEGSVADAVRQFESGQLAAATEATVEGHW